MKNVFPQENSILHDLSPTFRNQSGAEITSYLVDMYINVPVEQWGQILKGHFFSDLEQTKRVTFTLVLKILSCFQA